VTLHERIIVGLAVQILELAAVAAANGCVDTPEVRLALRCLRGHCPDQVLADFWKWARQLPNANRGENCAASLIDLKAALDASGAWPGDLQARRDWVRDIGRRYRDERDRGNQSARAHYWRPPARPR